MFYSGLVIQLFSTIVVSTTRNRQSFSHKWLAIYLAFSFVCDVTGRIFFHVGMNPNYMSNFFDLFGVLMLSPFLFYAIKRNSLSLPFTFINVGYIIFGAVNLMYVQGPEIINNNLQVVHALLIICLSIHFYYRLLQDLPAENILSVPLFWIISGFFLSYTGKLVIFTITNYMIDVQNDNWIVISVFHHTLTIVGYLIIAWGIWLDKKSESIGVPLN